jgi:hypothetical protein
VFHIHVQVGFTLCWFELTLLFIFGLNLGPTHIVSVPLLLFWLTCVRKACFYRFEHEIVRF